MAGCRASKADSPIEDHCFSTSLSGVQKRPGGTPEFQRVQHTFADLARRLWDTRGTLVGWRTQSVWTTRNRLAVERW